MPHGSPSLPPAVILCGGAGTRLRAEAPSIPKPLVEIGGRPILWHVIQLFLAQGFSDVLLVTGFRADAIERFVATERWPVSAAVRCVWTGTETPTGGRLRRAAEILDAPTVCVAYADGLSDIDLSRLVASHRDHPSHATMTVVRPELPFGVAELDGDGVICGFQEKPLSEQWVNAGFFCFEHDVLARLEPDSTLEREPLARLAAARELHAFHHAGFWRCMDTYKDAVALNELWESGTAPWKIW